MHQFFIRDSCFCAFSPCSLLTPTASVTAAQKCESKLSRFLALHTFVSALAFYYMALFQSA